MIDPSARERAATDLLDAWPWELGAVVIGGYVNAAYGRLRYSNDLDFVIPVDALQGHLDWLHAHGFEDERVPDDLEQNYTGRTARLRQDDVTVDLLPGGVMDRQAKVHVPQTWLAKDPVMTRLILFDASTRTEVPVCRPAAFWALKLQAGRRQDLADLMDVPGEPGDMAEVRRLFESLERPSLVQKLQAVRAGVDDPKILHDVMSVKAAGSPSSAQNQREWARFKDQVRRAIPW